MWVAEAQGPGDSEEGVSLRRCFRESTYFPVKIHTWESSEELLCTDWLRPPEEPATPVPTPTPCT